MSQKFTEILIFENSEIKSFAFPCHTNIAVTLNKKQYDNKMGHFLKNKVLLSFIDLKIS